MSTRTRTPTSGLSAPFRGFTQPSRQRRAEHLDRRVSQRRVLTVPNSHCRIDRARCRASKHESIRLRVSTRGCPRQRTSMPGTRSFPNTGVAVSRAPSDAMDTAIASRRASRGISATGQVWPVNGRPCAEGAVRREAWIVSTSGSIPDDPNDRPVVKDSASLRRHPRYPRELGRPCSLLRGEDCAKALGGSS